MKLISILHRGLIKKEKAIQILNEHGLLLNVEVMLSHIFREFTHN